MGIYSLGGFAALKARSSLKFWKVTLERLEWMRDRTNQSENLFLSFISSSTLSLLSLSAEVHSLLVTSIRVSGMTRRTRRPV